MIKLPPLYRDLTFLSPLSHERAASLARFVADARPANVLDVGCGWGEMLMLALEAAPEATGLGVDTDEKRVTEASRRAAERSLGQRAQFEVRDGREVTGEFDAVMCLGASQVWGPPVEDGAPLDYAAALTGLRGLLRPGGRLVYGEATWSSEPTPAATAALSGRDDEFITPEALAELARKNGFTVVDSAQASQQEWDDFESGFVVRFVRWLATHPADHEDAATIREQLVAQRERYLHGYRGVLGMTYLQLAAR